MSSRLAVVLEECIPVILDEWGRAAHGGELGALDDPEMEGDLGKVLQAMADAFQPHRPGSTSVDDFIETAAAHGARRRTQGLPESCLFEEYDLLGSAVPRALRGCQSAGHLSPEDLVALEGGLTTAILAGLRGFHRGEFERRAPWPETLARVATEASELSPRRHDTPPQRSRDSI